MANSRNRIFVAYSHQNKRYLDELETHITPIVRPGTIDFWSDQEIRPGDDFKAEIIEAISRSRIAILLVSADFLASSFIHTIELPRILADARRDALRVLWICISACDFEPYDFANLQAVHDAGKPLNSLSRHEKDLVWVAVCREVRRLCNDLRAVPVRGPTETGRSAPFHSCKQFLMQMQSEVQAARQSADHLLLADTTLPVEFTSELQSPIERTYSSEELKDLAWPAVYWHLRSKGLSILEASQTTRQFVIQVILEGNLAETYEPASDPMRLEVLRRLESFLSTAQSMPISLDAGVWPQEIFDLEEAKHSWLLSRNESCAFDNRWAIECVDQVFRESHYIYIHYIPHSPEGPLFEESIWKPWREGVPIPSHGDIARRVGLRVQDAPRKLEDMRRIANQHVLGLLWQINPCINHWSNVEEYNWTMNTLLALLD